MRGRCIAYGRSANRKVLIQRQRATISPRSLFRNLAIQTLAFDFASRSMICAGAAAPAPRGARKAHDYFSPPAQTRPAIFAMSPADAFESEKGNMARAGSPTRSAVAVLLSCHALHIISFYAAATQDAGAHSRELAAQEERLFTMDAAHAASTSRPAHRHHSRR